MIEEKTGKAIKLLKSIKADEIELCFSGGKDSAVILELARMADIPIRPIYKQTTIDPAGTIKYCRENGVEIHKPKVTFFDLIKQRGFPTRRCRFCCDELKEYKILDNAIQGIRRSESAKRKERYKEPVICRIYGNNKDKHVNVFLPILEWKDADIKEFVELRKLKLHPLYYNDEGEFEVKRRLGCLCCPLQSDKGLADFKCQPCFVKKWIKSGMEWWNKPHRTFNTGKRFNNVYELFAHNIFFSSYESFDVARNGFFGKIDFKERLENYFNIKFD